MLGMTATTLGASHPGFPHPAAVNIDDWSPAVMSAELARGTLVRCGPGVRLASWPDTAEVRAQVLRRVIGSTLMPILMSAAWVWGCARTPGSPLVCATVGATRPKLADGGTPLQVHEFRYPDSDLSNCGTIVLPSPVRTACDLLRLSTELTLEIVIAARLLALRAELDREAWEVALLNGPSKDRIRAFRRVAALSS